MHATQRLAEAAARAGARLVLASSSSVYGAPAALPVSESAPTRPLSPYGASKLSGEEICRAYERAQGLELVVLRLFSVYGPRQRPDMAFSRFVTAALGDRALTVYGTGAQRRDFTHVSDVVRAIVSAGLRSGAAGHTINVAAGGSIRLGDALDVIAGCLGRRLRIEREPARPDEPDATQGDIALATELLGYRPSVALEHGLPEQVRHMTSVQQLAA